MTSLTLLAALAIVAGGGELQEGAGPRLSLRVQGGLVYPTGMSTPTDQPAQAKEKLRLGRVFDLALAYRLHSNVSLEVATGLRRFADAEETTALVQSTGYPASWTEFELTTVPLTLGLRAGSSSGRLGYWLTLGAGAFLSFAHESFFDYHGGGVANEDEQALGFGGYAGIAFDGEIGPRTRLGLELRFVKAVSAFERLNYAGDGLQLMAGLTYRFGEAGASATARSAPAVAAMPAPGEPGTDVQPAPAGGARRWRFLARLGGFFPMSRDLDALGNGLEAEVGLARAFAPWLDGELAVGYFGAKTELEGGSLPQLIVVPVTVSARLRQPLGGDFEASAYAGAGAYVANFKSSTARDDTSLAPGFHAGVSLAARIRGEGAIGLDARLVKTTVQAGGPYAEVLDVSGARVGATLAVPF